MIDAIWCVLMYYFDRLSFKKYHYLLKKITIIATHLGFTLAKCYLALWEIFKKHALVDAFLSYFA